MVWVIRVRLSEAQRAELTRVSRQAVGRVALRAQMVLLSGRGYSVPQIASIHDCGQDVVRGWLHRYEERGVAGLEDEPRSGRPPKDPLAGNIIDTQASQSPRNCGLVQGCWTVALPAAFLATRFGLVLSRASVRRYLHLQGRRWRRPRLDPARKQDPEAMRKLAALERARGLAVAGLAQLLYFDECDLHLMPAIRSMWMKGRRARVPTPGKNRRHAFFGDAVKVLDWPHVWRAVVRAVRAARPGKQHRRVRKGLYESLRDQLWHGEVDEAVGTLVGLRGAEEVPSLEAAMGYLSNQRDWIGDYEAWRDQGYPVGSGLVERQVELVINRRLKRRGMRWLRANADAVVALRVEQLNCDWEEQTAKLAA